MPVYPNNAGHDRKNKMGVLALGENGDPPTPIIEHCRDTLEFALLLSRQQVLDTGRWIALTVKEAGTNFRQPCVCG